MSEIARMGWEIVNDPMAKNEVRVMAMREIREAVQRLVREAIRCRRV
jgi:hypothetical protein